MITKHQTTTLEEKLKTYTKGNSYPFHMPGHKRQNLLFENPYQIDITEIDGFDNLHHADGILKEAQKKAADLYKAKNAWYLINGSTCGLLAAISAAVPKGKKILVARNCHKAVYHAIYLRELIPVYLYPEITGQGLQGQILPVTLEKAIAENPDACGVIVTSPTYDGIVSNIEQLASLAHEAGMPLIVDQAHGAHFGMAEWLPENAGMLGADMVVVSVHKTLPAFTQTALLLSYSDRVSKRKTEDFLDIYETSSPSYILMAGIERCVEIMTEKKEILCRELRHNLDLFYKETAGLQRLKVLQKKDFRAEEAFAFDDSKILILTSGAGISGGELAELLRSRYQIELEMASGNYGLALSTVMDRREGFLRLAQALNELDREAEGHMQADHLSPASCYRPGIRRMEIHQALDAEAAFVEKQDAIGQISGDYLYLYPPGIPLVVPGEEIDDLLISQLTLAEQEGLELCGISDEGRIATIRPLTLS